MFFLSPAIGMLAVRKGREHGGVTTMVLEDFLWRGRVVVRDDGYEVAFKAGVTVEVEV